MNSSPAKVLIYIHVPGRGATGIEELSHLPAATGTDHAVWASPEPHEGAACRHQVLLALQSRASRGR